MSRQVEQALFSLMPSYGSDLPPSLVELAASLHAQSKLKASTLKTDEEIARLYACANLACDRLKISLDLPPIQARPPVPPRIYKRLYAHLDQALPQPSTPSRTRSTRRRTPSSKAIGDGISERQLRSRGTPTKEQSLAHFRTPTRSTSRRHSVISGVGLRPWVKPVIRYLCSATGQEELANTLVAGMDAITMSGGRPTDDLWVNENYTALFAALLWWTSVRAKAAAKGREVARKPSLQQRREVISLLTQARKAVTVTNTDDGDPWEGWVGMKPREFNKAVETVEERSWLGDWWTGIDAIVNPIDWDKVDVPDGDDADLVEPIRVRRADTMFQDKYDYLSEARMADFKAWRTDILASIAERKTGGDAMEIDTR